MDKSCVGCKFFYGDGSGYSNYTWLDTTAECALDKNPHFLEKSWEVPYDIATDPNKDEWTPTRDSRCESYAEGEFITLDPDRECWGSERRAEVWPNRDTEQLDAIWTHQCKEGRVSEEWHRKPEPRT